MGLRFQASTNTKQTAALAAMGVEFLSSEQLDGEPPVSRIFTELHPFDPKEPQGGGQVQWMLSHESATGVSTGNLMEAWNNPEAADAELDAFVDSLDAEVRAILKRLIPRAQMAAIKGGMQIWTELSTAAKTARKKLTFMHGKRIVVIDADYSKGVAEKFGLPYPNPALKQKR